MHVKLSDLGPAVRKALDSVKYGRADISVEARESVSLLGAGGSGRRDFAILVNLTTGENQIHWGSWGGANPWNPGNPVDNDRNSYPIPSHGVVILGSQGRQVFASLYCHPGQLATLLPQTTATLSDLEAKALAAHIQIKGGAYRRETLARFRVTAEIIDGLVRRGLLKRNSAGSTQVTTEGRNAYEASGQRIYC